MDLPMSTHEDPEEEPSPTPSDSDGKMRFTLIAASSERTWAGLEAVIHHTSGGVSEHRPCFLHYTVCMKVGMPVMSIARCDGVVRRGLQTPGSIDIIPLGAAYEWREDGPSTTIGVHLTSALVESTAEAMGLSAD